MARKYVRLHILRDSQVAVSLCGRYDPQATTDMRSYLALAKRNSILIGNTCMTCARIAKAPADA